MNPEHERAAFEKSIDDNPLEATNHLVYADWLDEHGEGDEAAFRRSMGEWIKNRGLSSTKSSLARQLGYTYKIHPLRLLPTPIHSQHRLERVPRFHSGNLQQGHQLHEFLTDEERQDYKTTNPDHGYPLYSDYRGLENQMRRNYLNNKTKGRLSRLFSLKKYRRLDKK